MNPVGAARILGQRIFKEPRRTYWVNRDRLARLAVLRRVDGRSFRSSLIEATPILRQLPIPISGEAGVRARAAADWLLHAQAASADDGVSLGYFPTEANQWQPSYPETTGYIISSLFNYARHTGDERAIAAAKRMAQWEIEIQMPSGAVQGGPVAPREKQTPTTFNTGMVLDGWVTAHQFDGNAEVVRAARRAADFLVNDLDADGNFQTHGAFVHDFGVGKQIKTYNCLCAWALYRAGNAFDDDGYRAAAVRSVEAALRQQRTNGWFANNDLSSPLVPLTHTIGYTLQGVLEVGMLADRSDFVTAAAQGLSPVLDCVSRGGYLRGRFDERWRPATFSSCLTGSAQLACVAYRLSDFTNDVGLRQRADTLVDFLKALQQVDTPVLAIKGALAGSYPFFGSYMMASYPNWATKYLLDALLLQDGFKA